MWFIIGAAVVVLVLAAAGVWLLGPTLRSFGGPSFQPSPKDDQSVLLAQQPGIVDGGGMGG